MNDKELNICKLIIFIAGAAYFGYSFYFDRKYYKEKKKILQQQKDDDELFEKFKNSKKLQQQKQQNSGNNNNHNIENHSTIKNVFEKPNCLQSTPTPPSSSPSSMDAEMNFLKEIQNGENSIKSGYYDTGIEHFMNALILCDQPIILLETLQKELPNDIYKILMKKINRNLMANESLMLSKEFPNKKENFSDQILERLQKIYYGKSLIDRGEYQNGVCIIVSALLESSDSEWIFNEMKNLLTMKDFKEILEIYKSCQKRFHEHERENVLENTKKGLHPNAANCNDNSVDNRKRYYWIEENEFIATSRYHTKSTVTQNLFLN